MQYICFKPFEKYVLFLILWTIFFVFHILWFIINDFVYSLPSFVSWIIFKQQHTPF